MQTLEAYRFRLEFRQGDAAPLHDLGLEPEDFGRAVEATFFDALRKGRFTEYDPPAPEKAHLRPRFAEPAGRSAVVGGFDVVLPTPGGEEHSLGFDLGYFKTLGRRVAAELAVQKKVPEDALVLYHLAANLDRPEERWRGGLKFDLESAPPGIPIRPGSRRRLGVAEAWDDPRPTDFPVLVPRQVLHEAVEEAQRAPDREVGGVLLGHLRRDEDDGELFLEVSCLVPAEETQATGTSVTFTHATWARAREVAGWRGEGEIFVGWFHSHPFRFCAECPLHAGKGWKDVARAKPEWGGPRECAGKVLFYSTDDEFLMELSFARPFMVGLLAGVEPGLETALGHLPVRLFGWGGGRIEPRGFEVIGT